jgi:hypothetical protein
LFFCFTVWKYLKLEIEISVIAKKNNSFVHFLGESMTHQSAFGFIWPLVAIHKRRQQYRGGRCYELAKIANSSRVIWSDLSISSELLDLFHLLLFSEFTWRSWLSYFSELASYCLSNVSCFFLFFYTECWYQIIIQFWNLSKKTTLAWKFIKYQNPPSVKPSTSTTTTATASKYIPKRPRICISWNPPFHTSLYKIIRNWFFK